MDTERKRFGGALASAPGASWFCVGYQHMKFCLPGLHACVSLPTAWQDGNQLLANARTRATSPRRSICSRLSESAWRLLSKRSDPTYHTAKAWQCASLRGHRGHAMATSCWQTNARTRATSPRRSICSRLSESAWRLLSKRSDPTYHTAKAWQCASLRGHRGHARLTRGAASQVSAAAPCVGVPCLVGGGRVACALCVNLLGRGYGSEEL